MEIQPIRADYVIIASRESVKYRAKVDEGQSVEGSLSYGWDTKRLLEECVVKMTRI